MDFLKPNDYDEHPGRYRILRVVVVSDTHNGHRRITIPPGDVFLHCGDFTNRADWFNLADETTPQSIVDFNQWLGTLPHRHKIVICGNHEIGFGKLSHRHIQSRLLTNCTYLEDGLIDIEGMSIYGSSWPFTGEQREKWPAIPADVNLLMTHVPPQFILDLAYQPKKTPSTTSCSMCNDTVHGVYGHWGSKSLAKEVRERIRPRVHCFGHVHDDPGHKFQHGTHYINAAADLSHRAFSFNFYVRVHKHKRQ